jgi:hypothetical protein
MYEKLLSETEKFIDAQKLKEVPILEVWGAMAERAEELKFDMPENLGDFEFLLEADKRFIFIKPKLEEDIEDVDLGEEEGEYEVGEDFFEVEKMEKLGFNQDQIVGLKKYEKKKASDDDDDDSSKTSRPIAGVSKSSVSKSKKTKVIVGKKSFIVTKKKSPKTKSLKPTKRKK